MSDSNEFEINDGLNEIDEQTLMVNAQMRIVMKFTFAIQNSPFSSFVYFFVRMLSYLTYSVSFGFNSLFFPVFFNSHSSGILPSMHLMPNAQCSLLTVRRSLQLNFDFRGNLHK